MGFPENLRRIRKSNGLSHRALAEKVGCTNSAISNYERETYSPNEEVYSKLLEALGTTEEELGTPARKPRGGPRLGTRRRAHTSAFKPAQIAPAPEVTVPEGKVKPCFNQKCWLNKNCFCQSPIVINGIEGCENQHKISEKPGDKEKMLKTLRNRW